MKSDSLLLARILRNYLSNAIRYARGRKVTLGCRRRGNYVEIQVLDSGEGIAKDDLQEIFKEFKRLKGAVQAQQSLGLGLAIVDKMAKVLEHDINVQSQLGRGSCFSVSLPIVNASQYHEHSVTEASEPQMLNGAKIWVIDNDPKICHAMEVLINMWECDVTVATSLDVLKDSIDITQAPCDILIVDYHLDHEQTGIMVSNTITRLRQESIPTIMISANYSQTLQEECKRTNIVLLNKPVKPLKLRMIMQQCLC